jgi:hypothetical protein
MKRVRSCEILLRPLAATFTLAMACAVAGAVAPAAAKTPAYVGTWAAETSACRKGQEDRNAPLIMKRTGYDQHETHCKFSSVRALGAGWQVKAKCQVEGDTQDSDLTLKVKGKELTMRDDAGTRTLQRCK